MSIISVNHLDVNYDQIVALTDLNFEVRDRGIGDLATRT